jgi:hypothetical protein
MNKHGYISIKQILDKIYREFPFERDIDFDSVVYWTGEALELIGAPALLREFITDGNDLPVIEIKNNRGILPCSIVHLKSAFRKVGNDLIPMISSTDTAFIGKEQQKVGGNNIYKITNGFIHTSFETGEVVLVGTTINTDEEGLPLIPDNVKVINMVTSYIMERIGFKLLMLGKIDGGRYSLLQQERAWYAGAADSAMRLPNYDEYESWMNNVHRLLLDNYQHSNRFISSNTKEQIKRSDERP